DSPAKLIDDVKKARNDPKALLQAARAALARKDYDRAEKYARSADQKSGPFTFGVFSETPGKVLDEVQAARKQVGQPPVAAAPQAAHKNGATKSTPPASRHGRAAANAPPQGGPEPRREGAAPAAGRSEGARRGEEPAGPGADAAGAGQLRRRRAGGEGSRRPEAHLFGRR